MSENEHKDERPMLKAISMQLDDSLERLDARTLSRLTVARQRAVQQAQSRSDDTRHWFGAAVFASLFAIVTIGWMMQGTKNLPEDPFIASSEDIDLIEELEFVTWLAEQDAG